MNLKDFCNSLTRTAKDMPIEISKLASSEVNSMKLYVNLFTPVKSGALKAANDVSSEGDEIIIKNELDYALSVEYGHRTKGGSFVTGQYFIRNGMMTWKASFEQRNKNIVALFYSKARV